MSSPLLFDASPDVAERPHDLPPDGDPVWVMRLPSSQVLHLADDCVGLERSNLDNASRYRVPRPADLAYFADMRPCRACALEAVLVDVFAAYAQSPAAPVVVSFCSQPATHVDAGRVAANVVSASGRERLERLAAAVGFSVAPSAAGPVAFGVTVPPVHDALSRNLRTVMLPVRADAALSPDAVGVFWTLYDDAHVGADAAPSDLWATAVAVAAG